MCCWKVVVKWHSASISKLIYGAPGKPSTYRRLLDGTSPRNEAVGLDRAVERTGVSLAQTCAACGLSTAYAPRSRWGTALRSSSMWRARAAASSEPEA